MANINVTIEPRMRRMGKFLLSNMYFHTNEDLKVVKAVMAKCIITRAEQLFHSDGIEYVAICDDFDEISDHGSVPFYRVQISRDHATRAVEVYFVKDES